MLRVFGVERETRITRVIESDQLERATRRVATRAVGGSCACELTCMRIDMALDACPARCTAEAMIDAVVFARRNVTRFARRGRMCPRKFETCPARMLEGSAGNAGKRERRVAPRAVDAGLDALESAIVRIAVAGHAAIGRTGVNVCDAAKSSAGDTLIVHGPVARRTIRQRVRAVEHEVRPRTVIEGSREFAETLFGVASRARRASLNARRQMVAVKSSLMHVAMACRARRDRSSKHLRNSAEAPSGRVRFRRTSVAGLAVRAGVRPVQGETR